MDFLFHKLYENKLHYNVDVKTLSEIRAEIRRGQLTHSELKSLNGNYIHTTTLSHLSEICLIDDINCKQLHYQHTNKNDILLARVGRGCIGKVSLVKKGNQLISDCVYRIRVPQRYLRQVWNSLCSEEGQLWLKSNSRGVCARLISKSDLQNFLVKIK